MVFVLSWGLYCHGDSTVECQAVAQSQETVVFRWLVSILTSAAAVVPSWKEASSNVALCRAHLGIASAEF